MSNNVTFVLGAGASKPYGLPINAELRELILSATPKDIRIIAEATNEETEKVEQAINEFKIKERSIDEFANEENQYGRIAIALVAYYMLEIESGKHQEEFQPIPADQWYHLYFKRFIDGSSSFPRNHQFVTFNYDRTFEFNYYKWIQSSSKKGVKSIHDKIGRFNHVYGYLGRLPDWYEKRINHKVNYMGYRGDLIDSIVETDIAESVKTLLANNSLRLMFDERNIRERYDGYQIKYSALDSAIESIRDADILVFLGYGFDKFNNEKIELDKINSCQKVYTTTYGLKSPAIIQRTFQNCTPQIITVDNGKCDDLVKEYLEEWS